MEENQKETDWTQIKFLESVPKSDKLPHWIKNYVYDLKSWDNPSQLKENNKLLNAFNFLFCSFHLTMTKSGGAEVSKGRREF